MRTSRVQQHLARANAGGGFFPLELLLRVAEGGRGEYWAGDRVRGDLDISWGPSAQRYFLHDLPEMFARLALELPREQIEEAIVAIFRDRCVRWEDLVINDRHFADWFYRRHGPAIERARRLLGGNPAVEELYRHRSVRDQLGELSGLIRFKLGHWASKAVRRRP
jgi:hypothetical protein